MSLRLRTFIGQRLMLSIAVIAVCLVWLGAQKTYAQSDTVTLGVSPQILDITANPGEAKANTFRLTNASDGVVSLKTTPKNFTPRGEEGAVDLTEDKTSYSLAEWISVVPESSILQPGQTQDFVVTISVPGAAEPGSYFGSVVFQTIPPEQDGSAALVSQEIAPVILVRIAGDTIEQIEIEEFKAGSGFYSNESSISLISRLKNTGNVHFKPKGKIVIKNMWGSQVAELSLDQRNVLPDSIRQIETDWQSEGFKIGRYTATLNLVYGENDEIRIAQTSFVIFPYQTIVPIAFITVAIAFILFRGRRRIVRAVLVLSGPDEKQDVPSKKPKDSK